MKTRAVFCATISAAALLSSLFSAQKVSLDPNTIGKAPVTSWPTFNGDYSGERYSTLTQISPDNLNRLALQWVYRITGVGAQRGAPVPIIKCTPLQVDGVLYITIPDHLWALDAGTGKELWHYDWVDHGGHLIGQRGVGIWNSTVFFLTTLRTARVTSGPIPSPSMSVMRCVTPALPRRARPARRRRSPSSTGSRARAARRSGCAAHRPGPAGTAVRRRHAGCRRRS